MVRVSEARGRPGAKTMRSGGADVHQHRGEAARPRVCGDMVFCWCAVALEVWSE